MILILKAKHGDYPVYARTDEEKSKAFLYLFKKLDEWRFYSHLRGDELDWYNRAKTGDARAAKWLLERRSARGYEYEIIEEIYPVVP